MKKNAMLKIAAILMVAVLLTTCAISSTFAKYVTTADGSDDARVAKWGVKLTVNAEDAFVKNYNDKVVCTGEDVIAPGTSKAQAVVITATGTPEVATTVTFKDGDGKTGEDAKFIKLGENWVIPAPTTENPNATEEYCPIVFTLTSGSTTNTYAFGTGNNQYSTVAALEEAINDGIVALFGGSYAANTPFNQSLTIGWSWAFGPDALDADANVKDTALGDKAHADVDTAGTIEFNFDIAIVQDGPAVTA